MSKSVALNFAFSTFTIENAPLQTKIPKDIFKHIFSLMSVVNQFSQRRICKSWNQWIFENITQLMTKESESVKVYHYRIFHQGKLFEKQTGKTVNWKDLHDKELSIDRQIIKNKLSTTSYNKKLRFAFPKEKSDLVMFQTDLAIHYSGILEIINLADGNETILKTNQKGCLLEKISNRSFATIEFENRARLKSIKIWKKLEKEPEMISIHLLTYLRASVQEGFIFFETDLKTELFSVNSMKVIKTWDDISLYGDFSVQFVNQELILTHDEETKKNELFQLDENSIHSIAEFEEDFLYNFENTIFLWDSNKKTVCIADLKQPQQKIELLTLPSKPCATSATENTYFFITSKAIHHYSLKTKKITEISAFLTDNGLLVNAASFLRMTDKVLVLSLSLVKIATSESEKLVYVFSYDEKAELTLLRKSEHANLYVNEYYLTELAWNQNWKPFWKEEELGAMDSNESLVIQTTCIGNQMPFQGKFYQTHEFTFGSSNK